MLMKLPRLGKIAVRLCLQNLGSARQLFLLNGRMTDPLNLTDTVKLPRSRECKGTSCSARTPRSADTVNIILNILRNVIIDDRFHIVDINAARRNIRCDQDIRAARPETVHRHITLMLRHIPVQSFRAEAVLLQNLRKLVHLHLRITEDQAERRLIILQQPDARRILILSLYLIISLRYQRDCQLLRRHLYQLRILLKLSRYLKDRLRHGRREQRRLMLIRYLS